MSALLPVKRVAKPWGCDVLPLPFDAAGERIGEIWFEPPAELAGLLVKYLFTSERLSVQVHPGGPAGKEECWLVVAAAPDAELGIGFAAELAPEAMRAAAEDGSIAELLAWHPVAPGDFIYIPAGTVHAIGAGVSLIEVQQNRDITYRLFDYGRPRELHLEAAVAIARGAPHDPSLRSRVPGHGSLILLDGPLFRLDRIDGPVPEMLAERYRGPLLAIPLSGEVTVAGELAPPGSCALAQAIGEVAIAEGAMCLLAQEASPAA